MESGEILNLESRRSIYEFVRDHPGSHLREVARSLGLPLGTALYHLDFLERSDHLVVRRDGRYKRFFVKHMLGRLEKDYVSAFHHDVPRKLAAALLVKGRRTQRELCADVGVSRSTLSFHVNNLVQKGILRCDELWPENQYSVADPTVASEMLAVHLGRAPARPAAPRDDADEATPDAPSAERAEGLAGGSRRAAADVGGL